TLLIDTVRFAVAKEERRGASQTAAYFCSLSHLAETAADAGALAIVLPMASSGTIAVSGANDDPIKRRQSCRTAKYEELVDVGKRFLIGFHGAIEDEEEEARRKDRTRGGGKEGEEESAGAEDSTRLIDGISLWTVGGVMVVSTREMA
ncbi:hypothetical protein BHM03_00008677, partial [Ensete ventricosum]